MTEAQIQERIDAAVAAAVKQTLAAVDKPSPKGKKFEPVNFFTGHAYTGKNADKLSSAMSSKKTGWTEARFMTGKQAKDNGYVVIGDTPEEVSAQWDKAVITISFNPNTKKYGRRRLLNIAQVRKVDGSPSSSKREESKTAQALKANRKK